MTLYFDKSGAMAISYEHPVGSSYCSCADLTVEYQGPPQSARCTSCHRRCPDEVAIYLALRDIASIHELGRKWFKKMKNRTTTTRTVLAKLQDQPAVGALVDQYGADAFDSVVKRLLTNKVFTSEAIAYERFPGLACDIPAPHVEEEAIISKKPAEDTPEKSDWELLAPADAPAEASDRALEDATPAEEAPAEDKNSPEEELPTTEAYPVEAYEEDPPAEAKPTEVEKVCEDCVQEEQNTIYLPFSSQHKSMILLQEVLEGACFAYGQRKLSTLLRKRGWNCVEAFISMRHTFDTEPSRDLLQSVASIQDTVVNRTPIDSSRMKKFLDDAVELTEILKIKDYSDIVKKVRLDIGMAIVGLSREEQEAEDQQDKKLKRIAEERMELDRREAEVREQQEKNKRECQKSTELEVKRLLDEAKKSLETTVFFIQLAQ
ncbi:hypothetical protein BKA56DRAFT_706874 [Ilyonectria sp. MPI-CAGE-AT-0026]|nr:hypothetical protein BKA56DRAFT_706874 [Ilyonectria sp. MPI-CAGE-AT-0026]